MLMKTRLLILLAALCVFVSSPAKTINRIVFSRSLCGPVKLKDSGGSWYTVSNGDTFSGEYNFIRGYDCDCRGLSVRHKGEYSRPGDNRSDFIRTWYVGESVLPNLNDSYHDCPNTRSSSSSSSSNSSSNSYSSSSSSYGSSSYQAGARTGEAVRGAMYATAQSNGYNETRIGGQIVAAISPAWGEHLDFRFRAGSTKVGFALSGAVGTDLINATNEVLWNVAIGMYFGNMPKPFYSWDIGWDFKFGQTCITTPATYGFLIDLNTTHLFTRYQVIGVTANVGIGGARLKGNNPAVAWDASVGLVIFLSNFLDSDYHVK